MSSPTANSPIADLSYRTYEGPLIPTQTRWWPIAKMQMRLAIKRRGFWVWASFSAYLYVILMAIYYFADVSVLSPDGKNPILSSVIWRDDFVNGISASQLFLFIVALLVGVGTIANDNRANALLIYLSKPCTKVDYLVGKWLAIFVPIFLVSFVPALVFYVYAAMSFRTYGFFSQDPWLIVKLVPMCAVSAFLHASLCLGISSLFSQGRLAGATYAGIYFIGYLFTVMMGGVYQSSDTPLSIVRNLFYTSVDGLNQAMVKFIVGTDGSSMFPGPGGRGAPVVPRPDFLLIAVLYFGVSALAVWLAWSRIKPVQVVGG